MISPAGTQRQVTIRRPGWALEPAIRDSCGGRLSEIEWFRATWRAVRSDGLFAVRDGSVDVPVIVKIPVAPMNSNGQFNSVHHGRIVMWSRSGASPDAEGAGFRACLSGHDLAWLVIERLDGKPVSGDLSERSLVDCCAQRWSSSACGARAARSDRRHRRRIGKALDESRQWCVTTTLRTRALEGVFRACRSCCRGFGEVESREINAWCSRRSPPAT